MTPAALAGLLVALAAAGPAQAAAPTVHADLVADGNRLGVRFVIPRGKHIYWSNPGDAGLPTKVAFRLPRGLRAGPLRWPVPEAFVQPGDIAGFGYEGGLVLWADLDGPPGSPPAGSKVSASVSWLECDDRECVPGHAELSAAWPIPAIAGLFKRWISRLPESGATAAPSGAPGRWEIAIPWTGRRGKVAWVAASDPRVAVTDVTIRNGRDRSVVICTVGAVPGVSLPPGECEIVAGYGSGSGVTRGKVVRIPVRGPGK
jgi:hypothetical protein